MCKSNDTKNLNRGAVGPFSAQRCKFDREMKKVEEVEEVEEVEVAEEVEEVEEVEVVEEVEEVEEWSKSGVSCHAMVLEGDSSSMTGSGTGSCGKSSYRRIPLVGQ